MKDEYKLPKLVWNFLNSFYPGNSINCLKLLHRVVINERIEFVFSLLVRQIRDIYWVKIDKGSIGYPSWRLKKLNTQGKNFSKNLLKEIIKDFSKIDIKVKTSNTNLLDSLDFVIATKLE